MVEKDYLIKIVDFIKESEKLKDVHRSAHTSSGKQESTAEHSWRLALLSMLLADQFEDCDHKKILSLCLIHDLGELDSGDIPAVAQVDNMEKYKVENETMDRLAMLLPKEQGIKISELFAEYNEGKTNEAKIVKALDKMETIIQHNQGDNPENFDYSFNLTYGKQLAYGDETLEKLRAIVDKMTEDRMSY